jgi:hypothetical protein
MPQVTKEERVLIALSTKEKRAFFKLAGELGLSVSQLVRTAVADYKNMLDRNQGLGELVARQQALLETQHSDYKMMVTRDLANHALVQKLSKIFEPHFEGLPDEERAEVKVAIDATFDEYFRAWKNPTPESRPVVDLQEIGVNKN